MRATRYVSYLATEIEPKALTNLAQFERATERAFDRISAFNDRGAARLGTSIASGFDNRARGAIGNTSKALQQVSRDSDRAQQSLGRAAAEANVMSTAFFRSAQALNVVQGPLGPLAGRLSSLGYIFRDLAGISLAGVLGGGGAFAIGSIASGYQKVTDRLRPFYDTQVKANAAMRDVIQIARNTRQALDPVAQLYSRLDVAGKANNVGANTARLTETVAKAARLSGGDAQTQEAGLTQFAQGFGSGTLGGDELRSIRENTFRLAKALADGLGVPLAKLKELGAEGKLTPQVIAAALANSADQIDLEFARLPKRIGQSLTEAQNNLAIFLGRLDETTGATLGFAKGISLIGNNIGGVVSGVAGLAALFAARSLAAPINTATTALERFAKAQGVVAQASRGRQISSGVLERYGVNPAVVRARRQQEQARAFLDNALNNQRSADGDVRGGRANLFQVNARIAAAKETAALAVAEQRALEQAAREGVVLAQARVSAAQQELTIANETAAVRRAGDVESARARLNLARQDLATARSAQAGATQRFTAANQAVDGAASGPGSRSDRARAAATAIRQQAVAEAELTAAQNGTAAAAARLAATEAELAAARSALRAPTAGQVAATSALASAQEALAIATQNATNSTIVSNAAANTNARRGIALLGLAEQRIAAETGLAAATARSAAASGIAVGATRAYAVAQTAFNAAAGLGARAMGTLRAGAAGLSAFLGGPFGIALTAITVGFTYLATRTDEAKEASERFKTAQEALAERVGTTTDALMNQSRAAQLLRKNLAEAGLEQARQNRQAVANQLANQLDVAATRIGVRGSFGDAGRLSTAASNLRAGRDSGLSYEELTAIRQRNPAAQGISNRVGRGAANLLGINPADLDQTVQGFAQTGTEILQAQKRVQEAAEALTKPVPKRSPIDLTGPNRRTTEQLQAEAGDVATGGTALARARKDFNKEKADLDAELAKRRKANDFSFDDVYVQKLAAAQSKLNGFTDGQRAAAAGTREHNKAIREQNGALTLAAANADKVAKIQSRYEDQPSPVRRGQQDKNELDDLFVRIKDGKAQILDTIQLLNSQTGKLEPFTRADADEVKRNIDEGVRKPINDAIRDQGRELDITSLILAGRSDEADLLRQKLDLIDRVGDITDKEEASLRRNAQRQRDINDQIAQRQRLIDIQARASGNVQGAVRDVLATPLGKTTLKDVGNIGDRLIQQFRDSIADKISTSLFGDAEQQARDDMTRGLNTSAENLTTSATDLTTSANDLTTAADSIRVAGDTVRDAIANALAGNTALPTPVGQPAAVDESGDIVVTAPSRKKQGGERMSLEDRYNKVGKDFASKVFGAGSIFTKAASKLGTFLSGAQYAGVGTLATSKLGVQGSGLGAALGGGLGKALLGGSGGLLSKGLTAISSKLGTFAGPLGSIAGSVIGSVVGGLFKKTKNASATITSVDGDASVSGNSSAYKSAASGSASSVQSGIQKIAEALGGDTGSFAVSIGQRKKKFVVDTSGSGRTKGSGTLGFDTEAEAVNAAILNAIQDGAVKGIRAGAQRLLAAGKDLDRQLQKATDFQNVFRELKQYTDPVGAAIDDLNTQFNRLIDIFNEAGASSSEFADLQKLYDLKRADAIKEATNSSVDALQDFINGITAGNESPLSRRTVYNNARTQVDTYRSDLAAGKTVDSEKLIDALTKYQDASAALNGSRGEFYSDFNDILALAEKAKVNIQSGLTGGGLPASPFADPAVAANLSTTADATTAAAQTLSSILTVLRAGGSGGYTTYGTSLDYLPSSLYATAR